MAHDVTQQVLDKKNVVESENRLQAIIEATPECIKIVSPDGKLNYMNPCGLTIIEGDADLLGSANILDLIAPAYRAAWLENHQRVCNGESLSWEFEIIGLKGGRRRMETHAVPLSTASGKLHLSVARDITEKKASELALIQSEEKFREFANNIQNLAWMAEPDGWINWYNERWFEYTGTNLNDMLGWGWEKVLHPDHVERVVSFVQQAWLMGETWELSFLLRGADGEYRWFLTRAHAVKDEKEIVIRWIGTNTNIDDQKQAEIALEAKNKELIQINNDLDSFIYTASHDLKAPISNIEGLLEILATEVSGIETPSGDVNYILDLMRSSIERFTKTIDSLTDLVKLQQENSVFITKVDLNAIINDVMLDLKPLILKCGAVLEVDVSNCPEIHFSEKNLRSVLQNLISNALKYYSLERAPHIKISCATLADYNVLTVEDNGLGISPKNLEQMFTMFKRFHDHVDGTGIGLYMIKKMVEMAGGFIKVESKLDIGTKFQVHFRK